MYQFFKICLYLCIYLLIQFHDLNRKTVYKNTSKVVIEVQIFRAEGLSRGGSLPLQLRRGEPQHKRGRQRSSSQSSSERPGRPPCESGWGGLSTQLSEIIVTKILAKVKPSLICKPIHTPPRSALFPSPWQHISPNKRLEGKKQFCKCDLLLLSVSSVCMGFFFSIVVRICELSFSSQDLNILGPALKIGKPGPEALITWHEASHLDQWFSSASPRPSCHGGHEALVQTSRTKISNGGAQESESSHTCTAPRPGLQGTARLPIVVDCPQHPSRVTGIPTLSIRPAQRVDQSSPVQARITEGNCRHRLRRRKTKSITRRHYS